MNAPAGPVELVLITLQNSVTGCSISLPFQYSRYLRDDSKRVTVIIRKITIKSFVRVIDSIITVGAKMFFLFSDFLLLLFINHEVVNFLIINGK